jgi:transketolase C-terminal domain/subunit
MLKGPEKTGSIRVLNKGVDVAVVASADEADEAMKASRILAVRGVSAAVLAESCFHPMDIDTLQFYEKRVRFFAGVGETAAKALRTCVRPETVVVALKKNTASDIAAVITELVRNPEYLRQMDSRRPV